MGLKCAPSHIAPSAPAHYQETMGRSASALAFANRVISSSLDSCRVTSLDVQHCARLADCSYVNYPCWGQYTYSVCATFCSQPAYVWPAKIPVTTVGQSTAMPLNSQSEWSCTHCVGFTGLHKKPRPLAMLPI
jgi:hypothetical protein